MAHISLILYILLFINIVNAADYYELLNVSRLADNREIRRAFKKLALKIHPDKNKDDEGAHEKFLELNKAYEVLKDEQTRKKYDMYGEEGLKDSPGRGWRGNYHSWNYYYENFGIYDDDPEIITLSKSDFEQSVHNSPDQWFVNFYSPQCSHCHHLAPVWRSFAREMEGVIRIGAVNCEEDWALCTQQGIQSYPSLILYPEREKYHGQRELDSLVDYVFQRLQNRLITLTRHNFDEMSQGKYSELYWFLSFCSNKDCIFNDVLKKVAIILDGLANVAEINCKTEKYLCEKLKFSSGAILCKGLKNINDCHEISSDDTKDIVQEVLAFLPSLPVLSYDKYQEIMESLKNEKSASWLIQFLHSHQSKDDKVEQEMKKLLAFIPDVKLGQFDCSDNHDVCSSLHIHKFPVFTIFKTGGGREVHHGRPNAHDIATFVRDSISSTVETLGPAEFTDRVENSKHPWFIDFFAPWCPPCMQLLPEWRKASRAVGHLVHFGTVDCTIHSSLCNRYNIRAYPTTILYNQSIPHHFHGSHTMSQLVEFVQDTLSPPVVSLSSVLFSSLVGSKGLNEIWVIDFFAPWCSPCQQLSSHWRQLGKMFANDMTVNIGQVDCQAYQSLCTEEGVRSYPTIRLYPLGSTGSSKHSSYNGWNRDASSLRAWVQSYLPSLVKSLSSTDFWNTVLTSKDYWLIDFYVPWCGHCQRFAPELEVVAKYFEGKINIGKVNCEQMPSVCKDAGINAYPTLYFFSGSQNGKSQHPMGEEIYNQKANDIISHLKQKKLPSKIENVKDEL